MTPGQLLAPSESLCLTHSNKYNSKAGWDQRAQGLWQFKYPLPWAMLPSVCASVSPPLLGSLHGCSVAHHVPRATHPGVGEQESLWGLLPVLCSLWNCECGTLGSGQS